MSDFNEALIFEQLKHRLPTKAAVKDFVHSPSFLSGNRVFKAIFTASNIFGIKQTFSMNEYRRLH